MEVIDLTRRMMFNTGNAVKYIARAGLKNPETEIEDLEKAIWYLRDEMRNNPVYIPIPATMYGEYPFKLSRQLNTHRGDAVECICLGTYAALGQAITFLELEIRRLQSQD
jgi:hypothetical protein